MQDSWQNSAGLLTDPSPGSQWPCALPGLWWTKQSFSPRCKDEEQCSICTVRGLLQQVVVTDDAHKVMRRQCRMSYTSVVSVNSWGQNVSCSLLLLLPFCPPGSGYKGWFALFDFQGVGCLEVHRVSSNEPDTTTLLMFSPWECVQLRVNVQKTFGTQ